MHKHFLSDASFLPKRCIVLLDLFDADLIVIHGATTGLLALVVADEVPGAIGPGIGTLSMFLPIFPQAFVLFTIRVVQSTLSAAFIKFEFSFIHLSLRPHVGALTMLLASLERAVEEATVGPLVKAITLHNIIGERTLVDLAS